MLRTELLLRRLNVIGKSLERRGGALLLMGIGSIEVETERMVDEPPVIGTPHFLNSLHNIYSFWQFVELSYR